LEYLYGWQSTNVSAKKDGREITEQTEKSRKIFRLFRYFRLFRNLSSDFHREVAPVDIRLVRFYSLSYRKTKGEQEMPGKLMRAFRSLIYSSRAERELDE